MELVKAMNALEPFLALTKSATSPRAAADLIARATSAPNTFVFTELLESPAVQALAASPDFAPHLSLLRVFSHGTYAAYAATPGLPPLNDAQVRKLRMLSLLTLARESSNGQNDNNTNINIDGEDNNKEEEEEGNSSERKQEQKQEQGQGQGQGQDGLSYARLTAALGLSSARELEDLVVGAVYAGLVRAQLDPLRGVVAINSVAALRDVGPRGVPDLLRSLQAWASRCDDTLAALETQMAGMRADADRRAAEAKAWSARMDRLVENEIRGLPTGAGGGGGTDASATSGSGPTIGRLLQGLGGGGQPGSASGSAVANSKTQRYGKRGPGHMDASAAGETNDEAMDVDEEEDSSLDAKKRASRRKLQG